MVTKEQFYWGILMLVNTLTINSLSATPPALLVVGLGLLGLVMFIMFARATFKVDDIELTVRQENVSSDK